MLDNLKYIPSKDLQMDNPNPIIWGHYIYMCVLDNLKYVPSTYLQMENPIIWEYFATNINDPEGWWYDHVM